MAKVKENGKCTKFKEFSRNYNDSNYGSNFIRNILIECSYKKEVLKMKTYVFENLYGEITRVKKDSMEEAINWFKKTYPTRFFSFVWEM